MPVNNKVPIKKLSEKSREHGRMVLRKVGMLLVRALRPSYTRPSQKPCNARPERGPAEPPSWPSARVRVIRRKVASTIGRELRAEAGSKKSDKKYVRMQSAWMMRPGARTCMLAEVQSGVSGLHPVPGPARTEVWEGVVSW